MSCEERWPQPPIAERRDAFASPTVFVPPSPLTSSREPGFSRHRHESNEDRSHWQRCSPRSSASAGDEALIRIGVARIDIAPDCPVRLHGYGGRRTNSEGVARASVRESAVRWAATGGKVASDSFHGR